MEKARVRSGAQGLQKQWELVGRVDVAGQPCAALELKVQEGAAQLAERQQQGAAQIAMMKKMVENTPQHEAAQWLIYNRPDDVT